MNLLPSFWGYIVEHSSFFVWLICSVPVAVWIVGKDWEEE